MAWTKEKKAKGMEGVEGVFQIINKDDGGRPGKTDQKINAAIFSISYRKQ